MGKTKPQNVSTASNDDSDELRNIVIAAMTDEHVISTIADKVANVISERFEKNDSKTTNATWARKTRG